MVSRIGGRFWERKPAVCSTASEKTGKIGTCMCKMKGSCVCLPLRFLSLPQARPRACITCTGSQRQELAKRCEVLHISSSCRTRVTHALVQVQHEAHGLAVEGRVVAAQAAVQHRQREHVHQAPPVTRALLPAVQPAHGCQHPMPAPMLVLLLSSWISHKSASQ